MPIRNLVEADLPRHTSESPQGAPDWMPGFMPDAKTLDYLVKLATFTFVTLGVLYVLGIRPRPVRAAVEAREAVGV